jgi:CheY-like chemotaxis protein
MVFLQVESVFLCLVYVPNGKNIVSANISTGKTMGKALILSDKPLLTRKEEKILAEANVQVTALSLFKEDLLQNGGGDFDIIVIDNTLHGVDLYDTCRKLRDSTKALIILLGNMPSWEMWEKSKEIGFDRYYRKPVPTRELVTKIKLTEYELEYKARQKSPDCADKVSVPEVTGRKIAIIEEKQAEPSHGTGKAVKAVSEIVPERPSAPASAPDSPAKIWQDPKVASLLSGLMRGKIKQLNPEIDLRLEDGFSYREADAIIGMKGKETALTLESLAQEGLLLRKDFEKILQSPTGSFQMVPVERCPQCDSSQLVRGQLIEHFSCGYIGLEEEFLKGLNQVCPKCKRELKLIGTDYRKPGMRYICNICHGIFPSPVIKCRCLGTGEVYRLEELREVPLYSYRLNEANKKRLEFELEPKRQLIECLVNLGYEVKEAVQVQGKSGATHVIDLLANKDDLLVKHTVAVGILAAPNSETSVSIDSLFGFDSKVYDAGIENKMVIAVPGLTSEAMKFAERQGIRVYRLEDLRALLVWKDQEQGTDIISVTKEQKPFAADQIDMDHLGPRGWLKWLLEKRGYHVAERLKVTGRSGADHVLDMHAEKDDGIINHKLAACVIMTDESLNNDVNEVIQFDTAAYDASIRDKIIISVPRLSKEARQFAEYQHIKVLEAKELTDFTGLHEADDAARHFSTLLNDS